MHIIQESLDNIERTVKHLKAEASTNFEQNPPVIAAPQWFIDQVRELYQQPADTTVDQIHGVKVVLNADIEEPFTISAAGRLFPVLPGWARQANLGKATQ